MLLCLLVYYLHHVLQSKAHRVFPQGKRQLCCSQGLRQSDKMIAMIGFRWPCVGISDPKYSAWRWRGVACRTHLFSTSTFSLVPIHYLPPIEQFHLYLSTWKVLQPDYLLITHKVEQIVIPNQNRWGEVTSTLVLGTLLCRITMWEPVFRLFWQYNIFPYMRYQWLVLHRLFRCNNGAYCIIY